MKANNPYWGKPYPELEELFMEHAFLSYDARIRGDQKEYNRIQREMSLILDAMGAYERGEMNK